MLTGFMPFCLYKSSTVVPYSREHKLNSIAESSVATKMARKKAINNERETVHHNT